MQLIVPYVGEKLSFTISDLCCTTKVVQLVIIGPTLLIHNMKFVLYEKKLLQLVVPCEPAYKLVIQCPFKWALQRDKGDSHQL